MTYGKLKTRVCGGFLGADTQEWFDSGSGWQISKRDCLFFCIFLQEGLASANSKKWISGWNNKKHLYLKTILLLFFFMLNMMKNSEIVMFLNLTLLHFGILVFFFFSPHMQLSPKYLEAVRLLVWKKIHTKLFLLLIFEVTPIPSHIQEQHSKYRISHSMQNTYHYLPGQ